MRLAVYGSLMRGGDAHHELQGLEGTWQHGVVNGWAYEITWGPAEGLEGLSLDTSGPSVGVDVIESQSLDRHLDRLDRSFGRGYRRIATTVQLDDGSLVTADLYESDPEA